MHYHTKCTLNSLFSRSIHQWLFFHYPRPKRKFVVHGYRRFLYEKPTEAVGFKFLFNKRWQYYKVIRVFFIAKKFV